MSSEISTETHSFRPWHLFVLVGLLASTGAVLLVQPDDVVVLVLLVGAIGAAAAVGLAVYGMLSPLLVADLQELTPVIGGRTKAAMEREKTYLLRAIKELEFDRAMGKVSDRDFEQMGHRLRAQTLGLMKQLDGEKPLYRDAILKELAERLEMDDSALAGEHPPLGSIGASRVCADCQTVNEDDARFCKGCGAGLGANR